MMFKDKLIEEFLDLIGINPEFGLESYFQVNNESKHIGITQTAFDNSKFGSL